ncbi:MULTISPECIES: YczE/YyaS/YitT family protein [Microbacterium]|uniref:YczE/YyaS/YitT family protein n=1 Tax=Microbacterium TaxID=33882 RepID=UPI00217DD929|nr:MULTISPECIES: hypothetical protein [Microbacterium]UWF76570.1 hypothetical protein JSY13_06640 [Microbacterium neungamense]WCM54723.1 hypothetical protein JRG78_06670 [Microbacterium sp. EF45047]
MIGAHFGPGPRDGLMTGLHSRTGLPIWVVRTAIEVTVVAVGWVLGGNLGIGTVVFALLVGPLCQFFLHVFTVPLPVDAAEAPNGPRTGGTPGVAGLTTAGAASPCPDPCGSGCACAR